jgi:1,4-dihydroxy-2-naphthoate polyprenyltransferase
MTAAVQDAAQARAAQIEALRRLPRSALWVIATRLKTLSLSVAPVLAGTWIAAMTGTWRADVTICAIISAVAIQIGTNLWNDVADAAHGVDTDERLGPPRVTALGLLDAASVRRAAILAFVGAAATGLYLVYVGGAAILAVGLLSLLFGYLYSMGPWPMSRTPFGEILVIVFFGAVAVAGTAYLHTGVYDQRAATLGFILGLPAAAVLLLNNHRDRRTDARAGRRTLAILLGERGAASLYGLLLGLALVGTVWWLWPLCGLGLALVIPVAGFGVILARRMLRTPVSAELNFLLPRTALFQLLLIALAVMSPTMCGF